ncbi:MAG: macro domain-containing protein [Proteobacteria bacterium]|nr:macro domain-containing protein [Pseudomonadota bacterium]
MITVRVGNLFDSTAQTLVNTVNCVGVMGKGIALEFKKRFPEMNRDYEERCKAGKVKLRRPYLFTDLVGPWVLNFPTKDHWRSVSRVQDVIEGLEYLKQHYREWGITSLAMPPLGCGQGQLEWRVVGPTLYRHLSELDIPVELFAPHGTSERELSPEFLAQSPTESLVGATSLGGSRVRPAWVALIEILDRISQEPYHWPVGRTTFQKIAYFATSSGLPTAFNYERGSYGPHAPGFKVVITGLVNQGLIEEERWGRMFRVKPGSTFTDARQLCGNELAQWAAIIDHVADLFLRMQTRDAEIAATVHFAAKSLAERTHTKPQEIAVVDEVMRWKQKRRPPLNMDEVSITTRYLNVLGWLDLVPSHELDPADEDVAYA